MIEATGNGCPDRTFREDEGLSLGNPSWNLAKMGHTARRAEPIVRSHVADTPFHRKRAIIALRAIPGYTGFIPILIAEHFQ